MASNVSIECGFDEEFVEPVGEFLKCIICHLVLRNPIQILKCGHRYCECCFNRIKSHSEQFNVPLYCPIDREEIDLKYVFSDTGMARLVGDLKVKCSFQNSGGCSWVGELRDLKTHADKCAHAVSRKRKASLNIPDDVSCVLNEFRQRLSACEETLLSKEKDIAYLKFSLQEMKKKDMEMEEKLDSRKKDIEELKSQNCYLTNEVEILKGKENVQLEGLCNDVPLLKTELDELRIGLHRQEKNEDEISKLKISMQTVKANVDSVMEQIGKKVTTDEDSFRELDGKVKDLQKEVAGCHCNAHSVELMENAFQEIDELRAQSNHVNDLLPYKNNITFKKNTLFVWRIYNLGEIFAERKMIRSPKFYCHHNGHICQLIGWFGAGADNMGIGFRLCTGLKGADIATFNCNVTLELMYNDGTKKKFNLTADRINHHKEDLFTLFDGKKTTLGLGRLNACVKVDMEKYIKNDRCTIICTLTPAT